MMSSTRPVADIIWCAANAPVVAGVFVGLGISAVGLILFPFQFALTRPTTGQQAGYGRAASYLSWARRIAFALGIAVGMTLAGYVIFYTDASGQFCHARFDRPMQVAVLIWTAIVGFTFALLVVTAILRMLAQRSAT